MARPRRSDPPPLETNDVRAAAVGAAAWAVALIVLLLIGLPEADRWWLWVCVTGIAIGLFGIWYIPRLQRSRAALIASHAAGGRADQGPPGQRTAGPTRDGHETAGGHEAPAEHEGGEHEAGDADHGGAPAGPRSHEHASDERPPGPRGDARRSREEPA
jgi:hypothetical protein